MIVSVSGFKVDLLKLPPWITLVCDDKRGLWQRRDGNWFRTQQS